MGGKSYEKDMGALSEDISFDVNNTTPADAFRKLPLQRAMWIIFM